MIKILSDYFINRRLSSIDGLKKTLNIQKTLENPLKITVLFNENLKSIQDVYSIERTIQNHYKNSQIEFMFFKYHMLYKDIFKHKSHYENIPTPSKFIELDSIKKHTVYAGAPDILFDLTSFDIRLRKMIIRTIKSASSVSLYENGAEDDFNILFKNSKPDSFSIFRALNFNIEESALSENLKSVKSEIKSNEFGLVLAGSSRRVKSELNKAIKGQRRFLLIEDLSKQLDLFSLASIKNCKEVICDENIREEIAFIKNLNF